MNGEVEAEAPRPRPLSAGIWTLFSWLRRADRSSSSESVSSVGSDRTVASFDFLAPLHYQRAHAPLVLPQGPLTDTYKHRLLERNLRRQHDRDLTLRRKYGLFREEGLGYDAFSLPSARRLQKDTVPRQDRDRRATSEIQRRSAYVPGKRRAPLPPTVVNSATLPRNYKRKRPAPKPPVTISEENKENVVINQILQMNPASEISNHSLLNKDLAAPNKTDKQNTKEVKLRTDKGFLKQIFDSKKRNSAIDTSRVKLLPSISELDKQAAEIIEANKALRASGRSDTDFSSEETWMCTTCLRKYKPVVTCCIYCMIKESSNGSKNTKNASTNASNICTQTDENTLKSNRNSGIDDKKKLREMLKEMKDSLPKKPKHNDKHEEENRDHNIKPTETPTLRIGSTIDENIKDSSYKNTQCFEKDQEPNELKNSAKEILVTSHPSSTRNIPIKLITNNVADRFRPSTFELSSLNSNISSGSFQKASTIKALEVSVKEVTDNSNKNLTPNNFGNEIKQTENILKGDVKETGKIHRPPNLGDTNESKSLKRQNETINAQSNKNKADHQLLKENKELSTKDPVLIISTSNYKVETAFTKTPANVRIPNETPVNANNQSTVLPIKTCESACSGAKDKIERIELGNVFSSNLVNVDQTEPKTSINSGKIDLHKPLKISSLLNPLYCPKYTSNDKVSDCNFAKILPVKAANVEHNKMDVKPIDEQTVLPKVTVSPSVNEAIAGTSNLEPLTEALQKSEARSTENVKNENRENVSASKKENPKGKIDEHFSSEVKSTTSPIANIFDHNMRRNLINQLEQAISKGDEQLAAEAAAKLAKLKLACSVLSFSSQIVAGSIPSKVDASQDDTKSKENKTQEHSDPDSSSNKKVYSMVQKDKALRDKNQQEPKNATHNSVNILPMATATTSSHIQNTEDEIPIEVWVEDKVAVRGPIPLRISRKAKLRELKLHVETSLGLEIRFQRWIVGRTLCTDDTVPLVALAGPDLNAPFFLCLVESETNKDNSPQIKEDEIHTENKTQPNEINNAASGDVYTELMKLEQQALVANTEEFECGVCMERCAAGAGAVLRECIHAFCRECLADVIRHCEEPVVACPALQCPGALQEREVRAILSPEEYERWLARGLAAAESGTRNTFHCRTRDCSGWAFCEPGVRRFPCPVCKHTNCVPCQAVHDGETCEQYQVKLREAVSAAESNQTDEGTQALLKSLISRGEALECPECSAVITKKWGCDWVKCSACKTEICWVTRGRRWGPGGKGDTSGGCKCGVDGKRCHPSCGYCH